MTYLQFIELLCVYALVVILNIVSENFIPLPKNSQSTQEELTKSLKLKMTTKASSVCCLIIIVSVTGSSLIGLIGMLCLWPLAPLIFSFGVAGKVLLTPWVSSVYTLGWLTYMSAEIVSVLDGVILALIFFGPVNHLFFTH